MKLDFRGRFDGAPSLDAIVWADFCLEIRGRRVKDYKPGVIMPHKPGIMFVLFCCRSFFSAVVFTRDNRWARSVWPATGGKAILLLCHLYRNRCNRLSWGWNHVNCRDHPFQHSSCSAAWIYVTLISIIVMANSGFSGEMSYRKDGFWVVTKCCHGWSQDGWQMSTLQSEYDVTMCYVVRCVWFQHHLLQISLYLADYSVSFIVCILKKQSFPVDCCSFSVVPDVMSGNYGTDGLKPLRRKLLGWARRWVLYVQVCSAMFLRTDKEDLEKTA